MNSSLTYGFYVCKRMWVKLYHRPIHLVVSFVQPIFWSTLFGFLFADKFTFQDGNYLAYLLPGICAMTVLQSSAQSGILLIKDFQTGFFGGYNFGQQSKLSILFYKIFADYTRIIFQVFIILGIWYGIGATGIQLTIIGVFKIVAPTFLFTIFYAFISCFIALKTKVSEMMATFVHLFNLPVVFTGTALITNKNVPSWLERFTQYNPVSHLSQFVQKSVITYNFESTLIGYSWAILLSIALLAFFITNNYLRTIQYD